jgi:hypothetical protein
MNIWNLPPFSVALLFFCVDFVAMLLIRVVFEKKFYLRRWWTFRYGDSIFLPMYGFFAAAILQAKVIQISFWWSIAILFLGVITMLETEFLHVEDKFYKLNQEFLPSQIYHGFIFVVMFYIIGSSLPVVISLHPFTWNFAGVIFAFFGYLLMVIKDYTAKKALKRSYKKQRRKKS